MNVKAAGLSADITVKEADFKNFTQPAEKAIMVTNPPYGERISTPNLLETYKMIGERLKHQFLNNDAWILSYRQECFDQIGLKPSIKTPLYNGSLECELRKYQIFDGKFKDFRSEGGIVKTEEEKKQMADRHRFKKNREFKKRLEETEENELGDIRSFKFHTRELSFMNKDDDKRERNTRRKDREEYGDKGYRDRDNKGKGYRDRDNKSKGYRNRDNRGGHEHFDRSGKRFGKDTPRRGNSNNRFDNYDD